MSVNPSNSILKENFDFTYFDVIKNAEAYFKMNVLDEIENFTLFDKYQFVINEKKRIDNLIDKNNHPYYISNYNCKNWMFTQFIGRSRLLNLDEFDEFKESVFLGQMKYLLDKKNNNLKSLIPKFSFNDFILGKECGYQKSFGNFINVSNEDYSKILNWRIDNLVDVVSYEVELLVKTYQSYCSIIKNPIVFIKKEIKLLEECLSSLKVGEKQLKNSLSKLFAFKDIDIAEYNDELLLMNHSLFINGGREFEHINPTNLNNVLKNLASRSKVFLSNEYVIFYTLGAFYKWLKVAEKGKSIQELYEYPIWLDLLNQKIAEGIKEAEKNKNKINEYVNNSKHNGKEIRKYLLEQFDIQLNQFKYIKNKKFFYFSKNELREEMILDFKVDALFNNEEKYLKDLKRTYIVSDISSYISGVFNEIFKGSIISCKDSYLNAIEITSLINQMIFDKDFFYEVEGVSNFLELNLSLDMNMYLQNEKYNQIFEKSMSRLQDALYETDPNNKVFYIQTRLKELKQSELMLRASNEKGVNSNEGESKYKNLFKEFLSTEADFIRETAKISHLPFLAAQKKPVFELKEVSSFENFLSKEKQIYILKLLEDLSITLDGEYNLTERKKSALRGVVEALRDCNFLPNIGIDKLCAIIAVRIKLELKSKLNYSDTSKKFKIDAKQYLLDYPFH